MHGNLGLINETKYRYLIVMSALCSVFFTYQVCGQQMRFDHLSVKQGLSQGNVWDIHQDSLGFIWIATEDGLNLFDGYNFTVFRNNPADSLSISNNNIDDITEDKHGNLWVGTQDGLNYYDRKANKFIRYKNDPTDLQSISDHDVGQVYIDSKHQLWVGTNNGLNLYNPASKMFKRFLHDPEIKNSLPNNTIDAILEDSNHQLWVGTALAGLCMLNSDSTTFNQFSHNPADPTSVSSNRIVSLFEDSEKNLWIGTFDGGLNKMNRDARTFTRYMCNPDDPTTLGNNYVYSITESKEGDLWVATDGALNKMDKKAGTFTRIKQIQGDENSLSSNIIVSVFFDHQDRLLVGTRFGGVNVYDKGKYSFEHYKYNSYETHCLNNNNITAFAEDQDGSFWIGTDGGGLNYYNRATKKFSNYYGLTTNNKILAVEKDPKGGLWLGMWAGGVNYFDPKTKKIKRYINNAANPNSLGEDNIFDILVDHTGVIWFATFRSGLDRYNPKTDDFTHFRNDPSNHNSLVDAVIIKLWEDSFGKIWITTEQQGIDEFDPATGKFTHYKGGTAEGELSGSSVFALYEDSKKRIWVGTSGAGLNVFNRETKKFTAYRQKDGLPNDGIMGILEDQQGNIWVSTNKGISRFNPETKVFKNFTESDGLQGDQFNRWSYEKLSTGELLFGGTNGFNLFDPQNIKGNTHKPPVYITDFKLFNKLVTIGENEVLKQNILHTNQVELDYSQNVFSFEFTALNYRQSEKNRYRYIMEGFQKEWIEAGSERKASYTNLSPGEYTFRVSACNNDGLWNEHGAAIKITIVPPFWRTWWADTLGVIFLASCVFGLIRFYKNKTKRQEQKLKAIIDERTAEVKKQSSEIMEKVELEKIQNWTTEGMALVSEALSKNNNDLSQLGNAILKCIIKYINAQQGLLALAVKEDPLDEHLKIVATYGVNLKRGDERIEIGNGLLGETYKDKEKKVLENVPDNYVKIESGLGEAATINIVLWPLKTDDGDIVGVMEFAFLHAVPDEAQAFLDKVSGLIALNIFAVILNQKSVIILQQSKDKEEESAKRELKLQSRISALEDALKNQKP